MHQALMMYFDGEKHAALFLLGAGLVGLAAAAWVYQPRWELRSLAITLMVFALIELAIGFGLYLRTGSQAEGLQELLWGDPRAMHAGETARMARVQRNFVVIESVWLVLLLVAPAAAVALKQRFSLTGIALGIALNAALLLSFDLIAERRGAAYLAALTSSRSPS